jgi:hypothetical protein
VRRERGSEIVSPAAKLLAVVTDIPDLETSKPLFALNDIIAIADFLTAQLLGDQ